MLITTRTQQGRPHGVNLKYVVRPTHTAFGHMTTDPPPGASLGA